MGNRDFTMVLVAAGEKCNTEKTVTASLTAERDTPSGKEEKGMPVLMKYLYSYQRVGE